MEGSSAFIAQTVDDAHSLYKFSQTDVYLVAVVGRTLSVLANPAPQRGFTQAGEWGYNRRQAAMLYLSSLEAGAATHNLTTAHYANHPATIHSFTRCPGLSGHVP